LGIFCTVLRDSSRNYAFSSHTSEGKLKLVLTSLKSNTYGDYYLNCRLQNNINENCWSNKYVLLGPRLRKSEGFVKFVSLSVSESWPKIQQILLDRTGVGGFKMLD
jgi:hypothetical protein